MDIDFKVINQDRSMSGYTEVHARSNDDQLGYAYLEERPKGELYIELVLTVPHHRRKGIGAALLQEIERYGRSKAFRRLTGEVFSKDYTRSPDEVDRRAQWFKAQGFSIRKVARRGWKLSKALR